LEYEDPDNPGVIKSKIVPVANTEFVVRAPFYKQARSVAVFREGPASAGSANAPATAQTLVLRASLPVPEAK
jgi:hypothetical protein